MTISWDDFEKIDIRTGTIIEVNNFPKARKPAYQLTIDFGVELGIKRSSAQITVHYKKEELINKQVIAVVNHSLASGQNKSMKNIQDDGDTGPAICFQDWGSEVPNECDFL